MSGDMYNHQLIFVSLSLSLYHESASIYRHVAVITTRSANVGLMLVHRLRRCPNLKPTLVQRGCDRT